MLLGGFRKHSYLKSTKKLKASELLVLTRRKRYVVQSRRAAGRANRLPGLDDSISVSDQDNNRGSNTLHSNVVAWRRHHRNGHSGVLVNIVPKQGTLSGFLRYTGTKQSTCKIARLVSNQNIAYEWNMYQHMMSFARNSLRMNPVKVLMVMNHRMEAHATHTLSFSVLSYSECIYRDSLGIHEEHIDCWDWYWLISTSLLKRSIRFWTTIILVRCLVYTSYL